jgi:hypothetical protein
VALRCYRVLVCPARVLARVELSPGGPLPALLQRHSGGGGGNRTGASRCARDRDPSSRTTLERLPRFIVMLPNGRGASTGKAFCDASGGVQRLQRAGIAVHGQFV